MQSLAPEYEQRIEEIKAAIQESEQLAQYLESEETEHYNALKDAFEPEIAALHEEAAAYYPLQVEALELAMLDPGLEGLFMPKLLGYAVLRPRINAFGQYYRPQDHLREVLLAIAKSSSFPELQRRIGQGVTVALALSSQVWVTSLIADIPNKSPRYFFQSHHDDNIRTAEQRQQLYNRYKRQFASDNYITASFPETAAELAVSYPDLEQFLRYRFSYDFDNSSLVDSMIYFIQDQGFDGTPEHERFTSLVCIFMDMPDEFENELRTRIRKLSEDQGFCDRYFSLLAELHHDDLIDLGPDADHRMAMRVGTTGKGPMQQYYALVTKIHEFGIGHLEAQDAIRLFIREHDGLSNINEGIRQTVLRYFRLLLGNLDEESYAEFFEISKLFAVHFSIFDNQSFHQELRDLSVTYANSLLRRYTDKRGKDYQDVKKFVQTSFVDLNFMSDKRVAEMFKTKRIKRPSPSA